MIRKPELVGKFEDEQIRRVPPDFLKNLRIFEALWEEARRLGVVPLEDLLRGD